MKTFIAPLVADMRSGKCAPSRTTPMRTPNESREAARALADALDDAMHKRLWERAERIAASAKRLADKHPSLAERLARLRLARHEPEQALQIIDACPVHPSSLRLLRAICFLECGRRHEAHSDLREWTSKPSAPLQARLLLALLEWQCGDRDSAYRILHHNLRQLESPETLAALMLISAEEGCQEQAAHWASRLQALNFSHNQQQVFDLMQHSIGFMPRQRDVAFNDKHIEALALELLCAEEVIPALVYAQQIRFQHHIATALRTALERVLTDLEDRAAGYLALVSLNVLMNDHESAHRWSQRGLQDCPMSASLARQAQELAKWPQSGLGDDQVREIAA